MPADAPLSHLSIKVDGAPISEEVIGNLLRVVVDHSLHLPSMFEIHLHSHDMRWLEDQTLREGKKVEISAGEPPVLLLTGKIAALEPELDQASPRFVVRGFDLSHGLYRGRHRRSFTQVTDSDLAQRLANESGLRPGTIDSTSEVHEYVFQNNQTNAEFLLERARRVGYELYVDGDALYFRRPAPAGSPIRLAWGETLTNFRARLSTAEQVNEVQVRGWDPKQKREVVGRAAQGSGAPQIGITESGAEIAQRTWGEAKLAIVDQFVRSPAEAEKLAQAALDEIASAFVVAEGTCSNPAVAPGKQVEIDGVGARFKGTYYVTQVIHQWVKDKGLTTQFVASGRRDRGVWSLLEESKRAPSTFGLVSGVVTNNRDPDNMGRVRVRFPWLSDQDESAWARMLSPMSGADRGIFYLPEVDDEVLVGFEHGDIHRPYVIGALWNGKDQPPLQVSQAVGGDGQVNKRIIKSRSGHTIMLDDTSGSEEITIVDKTGNNKIVFHSPDNSMQIKVLGDLTIETTGRIVLKAAAGLAMSSPGGVSLKGDGGVDLNSSGSLKLSGLSTEVSGTQVSVKGSGTVDLQGATVNVTGGVIKLNS